MGNELRGIASATRSYRTYVKELKEIAKENNLDFDSLEFSVICLQIFNYIARTGITNSEAISGIRDALSILEYEQEKGEV